MRDIHRVCQRGIRELNFSVLTWCEPAGVDCIPATWMGLSGAVVYDHFAAGGLLRVTIAWSQGRATWARRIDRAAELAESYPWAKEILIFYSQVLGFQREVYEATHVADSQFFAADSGLRNALNSDEAADKIHKLVAIVSNHGPMKLAEEANRLGSASSDVIREMVEQWLDTSNPPQDGRSFLARVVLEPQAERLAEHIVPAQPGVAGNRCLVCHSLPQLAVIRPEGDGGKRMLLCSLCQSEWEFRRILCPACGEEHHEKLPRYSAEGIAAVRVEACDACKHYLKSVDMTVDGLAVPVVDEIATAPLDLWAAEQGYRKIQLNLMGF